MIKDKIRKMSYVSVIMAVMNQESRIAASIESVLGQSFKDFEFIIVDDCSSDRTISVVERYVKMDSRIGIIRNNEHLGIAKSVNKAFQHARGLYIARIDSDDAWINERKLELQVDFLEKNPDHVAVGGGMAVIDGVGKELFRYLKPEHDIEIRKTALLTNPIANSTSLCRRSAIVGMPYDVTLTARADWDFWLKVGVQGKLYNFPLFFSYYTIGSDNHSFKNIRTNAIIGMKILNRYKKYYPCYIMGMAVNVAQYTYGYVPSVIRRFLNPGLSGYKKIITGSTVTYKGHFH